MIIEAHQGLLAAISRLGNFSTWQIGQLRSQVGSSAAALRGRCSHYRPEHRRQEAISFVYAISRMRALMNEKRETDNLTLWIMGVIVACVIVLMIWYWYAS